jgi:hypothetical protein
MLLRNLLADAHTVVGGKRDRARRGEQPTG